MVNILDANEATLKLYGAGSVKELHGELRRVLPQEFQEDFREEIVALWDGNTRFSRDFENLTLAGETKHVNIMVNVVPGYEETLGKVLVSIIDLTDRKKMEEELERSRDQLEHVLATNPAVLYVEEPLPDFSDTVSTFVSDSARFVLGFEPKRFLGEAGLSFWRSRVHPDDLTRYSAELPSLWREGHHNFEYRFLHSDGSYRWIAEQYRVIRDAEGRVSSAVAVAVDVTERKRLEEKLARAERFAAIGETAAMVGHDLRNPLQGITGALHILRQESLKPEERSEMLQVIEKSVAYSDAIVRDLADYSAEIRLNLAEATPKGIVEDALRAVNVPASVTVQDLTEDKPKLGVDTDRMRRVFSNLFENAIEAMPHGGILATKSVQSNGMVEISLSDTGSGMTEEVMGNLWKPLQTTKAKGLGLGLAICKRIVEAHGGRIFVKSKVGEGTAVTVRLPVQVGLVEVRER
jgi:PAS domain S-box-containing protein